MRLVISDLSNEFLTLTNTKIIEPKNNIKNCIGCFGCWIKTPGECVLKDGYNLMGQYLSQCTELLVISEMKYGGPSPFVKNVFDRALGYIHPYFEKRHGEMHHKRRYENVVTINTLYYGTNITDKEKETAIGISKANAINYDGVSGYVRFFDTKEALKEALNENHVG